MTYVLALMGAAFGIGLIVLLNVAMGWTRLQLDSAAAAQRFLKRDVMGFRPGVDELLTPDRRGYLCLEADGRRLGLVLARGDTAVVRALGRRDVRHVEAHGSTLTMTLDDYTLPRVVMEVGRDGQALDWAQRIEAFVRVSPRTSREEARHAKSA